MNFIYVKILYTIDKWMNKQLAAELIATNQLESEID